MEEFKRQLQGVYSTAEVQSTLDESPMAYMGLDAILGQIGPTAEVVKQLRPVYNFKAGTEYISKTNGSKRKVGKNERAVESRRDPFVGTLSTEQSKLQ